MISYCYPDGKKKVITMSYDDGRIYDRKLIEIFNKHGIKGTFHLNSGFFGKDRYVESSEIVSLYKGHEVSVHTSTHPWPTRIPREMLIKEVMEDRNKLEELTGYPVRGMSYPFGDYNQEVVNMLPMLGMEYSRTTLATHSYKLPENFLTWHPTCHHNDNLLERTDAFLKSKYVSVLYVWGHSYEFNDQDNWKLIEDFCTMAGNNEDIWYATNIEIVDYMNACRSLKFTASCSKVYNPSALAVWIDCDGTVVKVAGGETVLLS